MAKFREGQRVKLSATAHTSSGSGYAGDRGKVVRLESPAFGDDLYYVQLDGGIVLSRVRESDLYSD